MNIPTPDKALLKRRLAVIAVGVALVIAGAVSLLPGKKAAEEALPTDNAAPADVKTLPLPTAQEVLATYGGLSKNTEQQSLVARVGNHIVKSSDASKLSGTMRFYVMADENRINVFALPDGTIFITSLLLNHLKTEGQLAAMLSHEIAQVTHKHRPHYEATGQIVFDQDQELRADATGVKLMSQAGYNPQALIDVLMVMRDINMNVPVEFFVSHPSPVNRVARIEFAIKQQFPDGVPDALSK